MPDMAMCRDNECPIKERCYRYTAQPDKWNQVYGDFKYPKDAEKCDYFWSNENPNIGVDL